MAKRQGVGTAMEPKYRGLRRSSLQCQGEWEPPACPGCLGVRDSQVCGVLPHATCMGRAAQGPRCPRRGDKAVHRPINRARQLNKNFIVAENSSYNCSKNTSWERLGTQNCSAPTTAGSALGAHTRGLRTALQVGHHVRTQREEAKVQRACVTPVCPFLS